MRDLNTPLSPASPPAWALSGWPLRSHLEMTALPTAVPCARLHTRLVLQEWGLHQIAGDAELVVSELVTNSLGAYLPSAWPRIVRLWLLSDTRQLVAAVWDSSPHPPVIAPSGADAESGRGLRLVDAFSDRWSWYAPPGTGGKVVWSQLQADPSGD
jgi:hypothetical protein